MSEINTEINIESLLPSYLQSDSVKIHTEMNSTDIKSERYWKLLESLAVIEFIPKIQFVIQEEKTEEEKMNTSEINRGSGRRRGRKPKVS